MPIKQAYSIGLGSLTPKRDECTNLLVPVCISATHVVYGSMRMEPVFMVLGQSAATVAVQSLEANVCVQDVPREALRARLVADQQVLSLATPKRPAAARNRPAKAG